MKSEKRPRISDPYDLSDGSDDETEPTEILYSQHEQNAPKEQYEQTPRNHQQAHTNPSKTIQFLYADQHLAGWNKKHQQAPRKPTPGPNRDQKVKQALQPRNVELSYQNKLQTPTRSLSKQATELSRNSPLKLSNNTPRLPDVMIPDTGGPSSYSNKKDSKNATKMALPPQNQYEWNRQIQMREQKMRNTRAGYVNKQYSTVKKALGYVSGRGYETERGGMQVDQTMEPPSVKTSLGYVSDMGYYGHSQSDRDMDKPSIKTSMGYYTEPKYKLTDKDQKLSKKASGKTHLEAKKSDHIKTEQPKENPQSNMPNGYQNADYTSRTPVNENGNEEAKLENLRGFLLAAKAENPTRNSLHGYPTDEMHKEHPKLEDLREYLTAMKNMEHQSEGLQTEPDLQVSNLNSYLRL